MTRWDSYTSTVVREVRPLVKRVGLAIGFGFLVLVAVPVTAAATIAISGGSDSVALGLLAFAVVGGFLVLLSLPLAAVCVALLLGSAAVSIFSARLTEQRVRALRRVEEFEESRWWGSLVRPSETARFLDPRTDAERFEADLDEAKSAYVSGDVSEAELERALDRLFELETR